jgi:hypothetical protein
MRILGTFNPRYEGKLGLTRLVVALDRVAQEARRRGETLPRFAELADQAEAVHNDVKSAYLRVTQASAELQAAVAACANAQKEGADQHRRLAGWVYCLVGSDEHALDAFGLRMQKASRRKPATTEAPGESRVHATQPNEVKGGEQ